MNDEVNYEKDKLKAKKLLDKAKRKFRAVPRSSLNMCAFAVIVCSSRKAFKILTEEFIHFMVQVSKRWMKSTSIRIRTRHTFVEHVIETC